jgi:cell wall-associated NlpC family hydrolase
MRRFKIPKSSCCRVQYTVMMIVVAAVAALPMLISPLGLTSALIQTPVTVTEAPAAESPAVPSPEVLLAAPADLADVSFNRSQNAAELTARIESGESRIDAAMNMTQTDADETEPEPTGPERLPVDYDVYINADVLNVRSDASTDSDVVAKITMGDRIHAVAEFGEWLEVEADDQIGFVKQEFTQTSMVFRPVDETLYVKGTSLNVRDDHSTDSDILANLTSGAKVRRTGIGDEWSRIELSDGQTGYVASRYLTKTAARTASTAASGSPDTISASSGKVSANPSGNTIVDLASQALGTPYVFGSESLKGMDCSGLVYWAYKQVGVSVPRSSFSFGTAGEGVSLSDAQPGDVLCIDARPSDGRSSITHLAIYIGNNQTIHASTSQRKVVETSVSTFTNAGYSILSVRRFPN